MKKTKKNKYRPEIDWVLIEPDWAAGQLGKAEIGRKFEVSPAALNKHFKKTGLVYGSLSSSVRLKIGAKLVERPDDDQVPVQVSGAKPEDVVEEAAERGASVIRSHRKDIANQLVIKAKSEALLLAIKTPETEGAGKLGFDELQSIKLFIDAADRLAQTTERLIKLQRVAFNLDDESAAGSGLHEVVIHTSEQT
jgi:hypothetical protein